MSVYHQKSLKLITELKKFVTILIKIDFLTKFLFNHYPNKNDFYVMKNLKDNMSYL